MNQTLRLEDGDGDGGGDGDGDGDGDGECDGGGYGEGGGDGDGDGNGNGARCCESIHSPLLALRDLSDRGVVCRELAVSLRL